MVGAAALMAGLLTPTSLFVLLNIVIATIFIISAFGFGNNKPNQQHQEQNRRHHQHPGENSPQLFRAPSLFSRVTSFNFSHYNHPHQYYSQPDDAAKDRPDPTPMTPPGLPRSPSFLSRVASFGLYRAQAYQPDPPQPVVTAPGPVVVPESESKRRVAEEVGSEPREEVRKSCDEGEEVTESPMVLEKKAEEEVAVDDKGKGEAKKTAAEARRPQRNVNKKLAGGKKPKPAVEAAALATAKTVPVRIFDEEVDAKADDFINKFKHELKLQRLESLLRHQSC